MLMARGESEKMRAVLHALAGILAILFGHIVPMEDASKLALVYQIGCVFVAADIVIRFPWYHLFIKPQEVNDWGLVRRGIRRLGIFLEKWILLKTKILRLEERAFLSTTTPFFLGILIPITLGVPLYAVMVGIIVLGFGDPAAREVAIWIYQKFGVRHQVRENGKKTWQGFWGFIASAGVAVLVSVILDWPFPVYPDGEMGQLVLALLLGIFAGAFAELADEILESKTRSLGTWTRKMLLLFFDDNLTIPVTTACVVWLVMAI